MDDIAVGLIIFFSIVPDLDIFYGARKAGGIENLDDEFQHHFFSWSHYPLTYTPFIFLFIISLIFNFYPTYFIIPIIGIYMGHFMMDTIACGDGIMWGKNPFKKDRYARFINIWCSKTDGYHGLHWNARYRQTIFCKLANIAVIISVVLIQIFQIIMTYRIFYAISLLYIVPIVYLLLMLYFGLEKIPEEHLKEPLKGRYADYRVNQKYINGLSEKNRKKHLQKYSDLLKDYKG